MEKKQFDFLSSAPICVDKTDVEELEKEFPGAVGAIHKALSGICEHYNKKPFNKPTRKFRIHCIKRDILLRNINISTEKEEESFDKRLENTLAVIDRSGHPSSHYTDRELEVLLQINPMLIPAIRSKEAKEEEKISEATKEDEPDYESPRTLKEQYIDLMKDKKWGDASELLANWIEEILKIYTTKDDQKSEMWVYKNGIYAPQGKTEIKERLRNLLGKWYSIWMFNQVLAKVEADTYIEAEKFFENNNPEELPVKNGILNIITKKLSPFTKDKIFFNKLPVTYNNLALCPQIEQFLKDVLADESDRAVFYEMGGYCLLKEYKYEKAFMLVGNGRNGKDKSLELIKRTIGIENCCSVPLSTLEPDSFIISEFFGKMANIAGDIGYQDLKDTSEFKSLTGRSLKTAPRKFLKPITFINHAKFIFACNDLPMVYDTSKGFWDRWILLEYPYTFITKEELENSKDKTNLKLRDENIIEKISSPDELSGLLNKFLDGLDRLLENKTFSQTIGSEEIKNLWIRKANSFMAFCLDCIEDDYESFITKKELRRKYKEYCSIHKLAGKSDFVIKRTLEEMFGAVEERKDVFSGTTERVWLGIKWKETQKTI